jgi:hypothetical protein
MHTVATKQASRKRHVSAIRTLCVQLYLLLSSFDMLAQQQ